MTILFAHVDDFWRIAGSRPPREFIELLNQVFSLFDRISDRFGVQKIQTLGDTYMAAAGVPEPRPDHAEALAETALTMQREIGGIDTGTRRRFSLRIGMHSGPAIAGVVGVTKLAYDLWGPAVNLAGQMESSSVASGIQVSAATHELLQERFILEPRGEFYVPGQGEVATWLLMGRARGLSPSSSSPARARRGGVAGPLRRGQRRFGVAPRRLGVALRGQAARGEEPAVGRPAPAGRRAGACAAARASACAMSRWRCEARSRKASASKSRAAPSASPRRPASVPSSLRSRPRPAATAARGCAASACASRSAAAAAPWSPASAEACPRSIRRLQRQVRRGAGGDSTPVGERMRLGGAAAQIGDLGAQQPDVSRPRPGAPRVVLGLAQQPASASSWRPRAVSASARL